MKRIIPFIFLFLGCSSKDKPNEVVGVQLAPQPSSSIAQVSQDIPKEKVEAEPCPSGMNRVKGNYCDKIEYNCIDWLDNKELPYARCKTYKPPAKCVGNPVPINVCMDIYEMKEKNSNLPIENQSYNSCKLKCEEQGKRLCELDEWKFGCSGPELKPYPFGWSRYEQECHIETKEKKICNGKICDLRKPIDAFPNCKSDFGIINQIGSLDEPSHVKPYPLKSYPGVTSNTALVGGHMLHGRTRCMEQTISHSNGFTQRVNSCRCCQ